jgi:L-rhamnose isomerase
LHGLPKASASSLAVELGNPAVMNIWIPDGYKDQPADRMSPRKRLIAALDKILAAVEGTHHKVAVEGKLFGIGAESYTVGSNEFYMAYAATRKTLLCMDAGHFHPTENVADKISTALCYLDEILLHVSRPVRWDSDHVVLLDDPTIAIAQEIVRCDASAASAHRPGLLRRKHQSCRGLGVGARNMRKALLLALLEPKTELLQAETSFDWTARLVLFEEQKSMPWQAVWEYYCASKGIAHGSEWLQTVRKYESAVLNKRV